MTVDSTVPQSRRALLAGGLGGLVAVVASALGRPDVARAGSDGDVVLGHVNIWAGATTIQSTTGTAIEGYSPGSGVGIYGEGVGGGMHGFSTASIGVKGQSNTGTGVVGTSPSIGVSGTSTTGTGVSGSSGSSSGVHAYSNATAKPAGIGWSGGENTGLMGYSGSGSPPASPAKTGVHGYADLGADSRGVHGEATDGRGVFGQATTGQGVRGAATTGTALLGTTSDPTQGLALRTVGRVRFDNSVGIATIGAGKRSVSVTPGIDLTSSAAVVATLQGDPGGSITVQRVAVDAAADTFRIYLTAAAKSSVKVAWHVFG
jgi:hypothetical protein